MTLSAEARDSNRRIIERYTDQPERLPADLRARIERSWGGSPVQLYAMADLDASMRFARIWVALGPRHVAVAQQREGAGRTAVTSFERSRITCVREAPGLSCTVLTLLGSEDEPPLAVWRYTHRQRRAFENLRFVLDEATVGRAVATEAPDAEYAESLAAPVKEAQALVAPNRLAVIWRLLGYLRPYRWQLGAGFAAAVLITLFSLVPPWLTGTLIDDVVQPVQDGSLDVDEAATVAWLSVLALALVYVLRQGCGFVRLRLMTVLGEFVARDLRTELYEHLQTLSLSFYGRKKTGSLITRVSADTDRLWEFLALGVVDASLAVVMLLGLVTVLISLDWRLGLVMALPLPLLCIVILRHGQHMNKMFLRAWRKWSNVTDVLADTIPGMRVVKAFNQEQREKQRFELRNADATSEFNRLHRVWTSFWPVLMLCVHSMTVLVWALALPRLLGTTELLGPPLSAGTFVSFVLYTTMFVHPVEIIGQITRIMNRATSSAHRVFEVLDTEPEVVDAPRPKRLTPVHGRVGFENVTFAYDGVRQVLRGVSFEVEPGEMVGLVGASGGGKTTIVNLIARFYDATGGRVLIDGNDVRELDTGHTRRQIGMVLQEPFLFHGTLLANIRYGRPDAKLDDVVRAARAANAHDFICDLAHGYDTVVGERGQTLSGGERQRISIARAILSDPRILILDEATSSVDTETERRIQQAMDRLTAGRTVFAIAHRLSTLARADRLFVVEDGQIVERGTHAELLARQGGRYRTLYTLQRELSHAV
jgi:ATP-binding cassette subfamily B protein